jgi:hypothetical protein
MNLVNSHSDTTSSKPTPLFNAEIRADSFP